jgi:glutathione S-transferase
MEPYELFYWPGLQGRGEFIRLALEAAGAPYHDQARDGEDGMDRMMILLNGNETALPPFAPPFLKAGNLLIGQTANILMYLGARHDLAPADEAGRLWANQLQLTISDFVAEVHETHHPIASALYYDDQAEEAQKRAAHFRKERMPKFLGYFERILRDNRTGPAHLIGAKLTYPDLSLFQMVAGLRNAFPRAMQSLETRLPLMIALHDRVAIQPRIAAYLASARRIPFNEQGIFRHYPELDLDSC